MTNEISRKLVMIVEDDAILRLQLKLMLQKSGFDVLEAQDAIEAPRIARENRPDLVLLDYLLPGGSGADVCRRMALTLNGPMPPIIYMSGLSGIDASTEATPGACFFAKPFDVPKLIDCIHRLLGQSVQLAAA